MIKKKLLSQIIRINHAGEYGAFCIYNAQLKHFKNDPEYRELIDTMKKQEEEHLKFFAEQLLRHRISPTLMIPIWDIASRFLGFTTARLGKKAAMLCTVAVEEVIEEHYKSQLDMLEKLDHDEEVELLKDKIIKFREDELEHHRIGIEHDALDCDSRALLTLCIKSFCKFAIFVSRYI
ncbi:demethoxyubiquinone hydroxylase family protein [Anaplasmataceae bacterium AB001_6]|nr:demethoxyubiquinone hydroxylase family protein [Anaplasmataceae bacterium AB001_6]